MTQAPPPPPSTGGGEIIHPSSPPKAPIVILLLNLFAGAGYFTIGQKMKGIFAVVLWLLVLCPTWSAGSILLSFVYAVDGFFQARQLEQGTPIGPWTFFTNHR